MNYIDELIVLVRKKHRVGAIVAGALVALATMLAFIPVSTADGPNGIYYKYAIVGFFWVFGGVLGVQSFVGLWAPERDPAVRALTETPAEVVWVYVERRMRNQVHVASWLRVCTQAGKRRWTPLVFGREDEFMRAIGARVPHAAVGYAPERDKEFRANPASLRRVAA